VIADFKDRKPNIHSDTFVAPTATVVGSVTLEAGASVWFSAVLRGDCEQITVGENSNVQDGAVLHADPGVPLTLHKGVTVGHNAMLHGCEVGDNTLIGINAVVLNGAKIGKNCLIGANTFVPENMEIPDGVLVVGSPAQIKRELKPEMIEAMKLGGDHYVNNGREFAKHMVIHDENKTSD
jgi:carbonic anhydrase/acetyltransferase-like protein (isoleucine patch superfamily)